MFHLRTLLSDSDLHWGHSGNELSMPFARGQAKTRHSMFKLRSCMPAARDAVAASAPDRSHFVDMRPRDRGALRRMASCEARASVPAPQLVPAILAGPFAGGRSSRLS